MKSLQKYAMLTALFAAAVVEAQTAPPAKRIPAAGMKLRVAEMKQQIDGDHKHVLHLQALAKKEKDVIKLTCINDKLVQLKAQMNLFDTNSLALDGAIDNTDDAPTTIFTDIVKTSDDIKKLRSDADGCAGELEMYKQESKADFERPELDDPTDGEPFNPPELDGDPEIDVPGYATPYM